MDQPFGYPAHRRHRLVVSAGSVSAAGNRGPAIRRFGAGRSLLAGICLLLSAQVPALATARITDQALLDSGRDLFRSHCAACHGANAEGTTPDWQERDASGKLPPPPLNGTAHTWHHPLNVLARMIRQGTMNIGGSMPAWGADVLSDDELFAIIVWFSSLWPDDLFQYWMEMNRAESAGN